MKIPHCLRHAYDLRDSSQASFPSTLGYNVQWVLNNCCRVTELFFHFLWPLSIWFISMSLVRHKFETAILISHALLLCWWSLKFLNSSASLARPVTITLLIWTESYNQMPVACMDCATFCIDFGTSEFPKSTSHSKSLSHFSFKFNNHT